MADYNPFAYNQNQAVQRNRFVDVIMYLVLGMSVLVVLYLFLIIPTQVDGESMMPNFQNDEVLLTNKLIQLIGGEGQILANYDYQRGDVVVFSRPNEPDLIKRIIGLAGDRVQIRSNRVYLNGQLLEEDYIDPIQKPTRPGTFMPDGVEKTVPKGQYFALGDNRTNSLDSRAMEVGFIRRDQLRGSPFLRLFPLNHLSALPRGTYS